ncbi:DUF3606 domain-containing protein [Thalassoroseus pseudoceratinae]|uniref:DUF3606 domain-containing protein n=1 Tax=Thalassoroseus pseudoceratinae TaxID=2713176 RepID=UPI00141F92F3|nr:DUF3606 domain-containing protein [Thalassoroseus pseudoceratinae]
MLESIPDIVDLSQNWLVNYWAGELGVSSEGLRHCVERVGPQVGRIQKCLSQGHRIAIQNEEGRTYLVARILLQSDGFAVSVPYHPEKQGLIIELPLDYSKDEFLVPLENSTCYTVTDTVKLSFHMNGFVQFSRGGEKPIVSGYNSQLDVVKGAGLKAPDAVSVTTGPLLGIVIQGLEKFTRLNKKDAEVFKPTDMWHHPKFSTPEDTAYHLEVFMFPKSEISSSRTIDGRRILRKNLPFWSTLIFPFDLRVVELPNRPFFLGVILSHMRPDSTGLSGYKLCGPSCGGPSEQKKSIQAIYPRPPFAEEIDCISLDYHPESDQQ